MPEELRVRVMVTGHRDLDSDYRRFCRIWLHQYLQDLSGMFPQLEGITGMARGADDVFAQECISCNIPFVAAVPFADHSYVQKNVYIRGKRQLVRVQKSPLLKHASRVVLVDNEPGYTLSGVMPGKYDKRKFQLRNMWMVDYTLDADISVCLAVFDGRPGGTANCVQYATKRGLTVKRFKIPIGEQGLIAQTRLLKEEVTRQVRENARQYLGLRNSNRNPRYHGQQDEDFDIPF